MTVEGSRYLLAEVVFVRFLYYKVIPPTLSTLYSLEGSHYVQSTLEWGVMLYFLEVEEIYIKYGTSAQEICIFSTIY